MSSIFSPKPLAMDVKKITKHKKLDGSRLEKTFFCEQCNLTSYKAQERRFKHTLRSSMISHLWPFPSRWFQPFILTLFLHIPSFRLTDLFFCSMVAQKPKFVSTSPIQQETLPPLCAQNACNIFSDCALPFVERIRICVVPMTLGVSKRKTGVDVQFLRSKRGTFF